MWLGVVFRSWSAGRRAIGSVMPMVRLAYGLAAANVREDQLSPTWECAGLWEASTRW